MGASNIQTKIQKGLAKAINKTGSSLSDTVYLIRRTNTGGNTPLDPPVYTESKVELKDAIFTGINKRLFDGDIQTTDKQLTSQVDVPVKIGDIIEQGSNRFIIAAQNNAEPTSDILVYISQVRAQ